jgi:hypothetical protein
LIVGQKKPLQPKHVWSIRVRLEISSKWRDVALFNLAIDSKLRACDAVPLLLGHTKLESTVRYLGIEVDDALSIAEQIELWSLACHYPAIALPGAAIP